MRTLFFSLTTGLIILISASIVSASSFGDTYGFSPTGISTGNAMTAHVNDWSSVYYNMAGLGRTVGQKRRGESINHLSMNYLSTYPDFNLSINRYILDEDSNLVPVSTDATEGLDFGMFVLGAAFDLNKIFKLWDFVSSARFGIGVGINDDLSVVRLNDFEPQTHNYPRYGRDAQRTMVLSGVGLGFMDDTFGVGIGTNATFGGDGKVLLKDVQVGTEPQSPEAQSIMNLKLKPALLMGLYFSPGKLFPAAKGVELGFSYKQKSRLDISPFSTVAVTEAGGIPLNLELSIFGYWQPDTYTLGTSVEIGKKTVVSFDVEYQEWSEYEHSVHMEANHKDILPDLDNIIVPKFGLQYQVSNPVTLLGGYYYQPSFIPNKAVSGDVNWLDNDKHVLSFGLKWRLPLIERMQGPVDFSIGYQMKFLEDRNVDKTAPDLLNPDYSYDGTCHTIMLGFQLNL